MSSPDPDDDQWRDEALGRLNKASAVLNRIESNDAYPVERDLDFDGDRAQLPDLFGDTIATRRLKVAVDYAAGLRELLNTGKHFYARSTNRTDIAASPLRWITGRSSDMRSAPIEEEVFCERQSRLSAVARVRLSGLEAVINLARAWRLCIFPEARSQRLHRTGPSALLEQDVQMAALVVELRQLAGEYVVARLPATLPVPDVLLQAHPEVELLSITRTPQELSIVCPVGFALPDAEIDGTWSALYVGGPIPFGLTGIVTSLVAPLSAAGCPVFVLSTFDGDVLMVQSTDRDRAGRLLIEAGHTFI